MGWNSYDAFGDSVTEAEVIANANYMHDHLLVHGWKYVIVDFRWYDAVTTLDDRQLNKERTGAPLAADNYGRLQPAQSRFPSAANGQGFTALAGKVHALGLAFGIHIMRGIPRQAVNAKTSIEGGMYTAADAGDPSDTCVWCPDMFGVRSNAAGQAWYDSIFRQYAAWGLDYVKVDDLSVPYHQAEIEMIRKAIDRCGRPIVFSTSPGPTPVNEAPHIRRFANMWRISGDFWDRWKDLDRQFDLLDQWKSVAGPRHWPDADMIPFGHIGIRARIAGEDRQSRFTPDERTTLMSLWALAPSPLMLGANLPDTDTTTLALLANDEVLAIDQDPLGSPAKRVFQEKGAEVWSRELQDGSRAIGIFNRTDTRVGVKIPWAAAGLSGRVNLRDVWKHADLGSFDGAFETGVMPHASVLLRATKLP